MSDAKTSASGSPCFKFETTRRLVPAPPGEGRPELKWNRPPGRPPLSDGEVHLWRAWLDQPEERLAQLQQTLSPEERLRTQQFNFDRDRDRFIAGRGMLRAILARYLGVPPVRIALACGAHGKPRLAALWAWSDVRFNVSHSEGLALCAVACGREVGVDLERARPLPEMAQVATQVFSAREQARLRSASHDDPVTAFFRFWTSKEALLKARGEGFTESPRAVELPPEPGDGTTTADDTPDRRHGAEWTSRELVPHPGFLAALVVEGRDWRLWCCDYEWDARPASMAIPARRKRIGLPTSTAKRSPSDKPFNSAEGCEPC